MLKYIGKRILWLIPIIVGVSFIIFSIMYFKPGDPAQIILGSEATQESIDQLREEMGLNDPFFTQYFNYMKGLVVVLALVLASMPSFWIGLILMLIFSVQWPILPPTGADTWQNYILPCATLAAVNLAVVTRMTRSTMLEVVRQDYVRTARAKGGSEQHIIFHHCLKNAMIPVLTIVAIQFSKLVGGAVLVESVFAMPGLGSLLVTAIRSSDTPLIMGSVIVLAVIFTVINLVIDLLYAVIDPRIKAQFSR